MTSGSQGRMSIGIAKCCTSFYVCLFLVVSLLLILGQTLRLRSGTLSPLLFLSGYGDMPKFMTKATDTRS